MCGNIALISSTSVTTDWAVRGKWIRDALVLDSVRGMDSTGVCAVPRLTTKAPIILKHAVPGTLFIESKKLDKILTDIERYSVLMGHNRSATRGLVNTFNAHPFNHGDIYMCHNGTISDCKGMDKTFTVDSEALCHSFANNPAEEVLPSIQGAFALQWYDAKSNTYNIARNSERTLSYAFSKNRNLLFVASDWWVLKGLADKHNIALYCDEIWSLKPGFHLEFNLDEPDLGQYKTKEFSTAKKSITSTTHVTTVSSGYSGRPNTGTADITSHKQALEKMLFYAEEKRNKADDLLAGIDEKEPFYLGRRVIIQEPEFVPYNVNLTTEEQKKGCIGKVVGTVGLGDGKNWTWIIVHTVRYSKEYDDKTNQFLATVSNCRVDSSNYYEVLADAIDHIPLKDNDTRLAMDWESFDSYLESIEEDEDDLYPGPHHTLITKKEFDELTAHGCSSCKGAIIVNSPADAENMDWIQDYPICEECGLNVLN